MTAITELQAAEIDPATLPPPGVYGPKRWLDHYPEGVPHQVDASAIPTMLHLLEKSFSEYADRIAFTCMGRSLTYRQLDQTSRDMAAYLQGLGLKKGDRVAVMAPNVFQQQVAVCGVIRAGFVVVNVNPLYTARELRHQLKDSGAKAIVILENFAITLQEVIADTEVEHVVATALGDMLGPKGMLVNAIVRHVKKMVPPYKLPGAVRFKAALKAGRAASYQRPEIAPEDIAVLQYTGGTTGLSKGAMLLHSTLISSLLAADAWAEPGLRKLPEDQPLTLVCALPLYHVFAMINVAMSSIVKGGRVILIPNARDLNSLVEALKGEVFHTFPGVNTLFAALAEYKEFQKLDFSNLMICNGGGMACLETTANRWKDVTGSSITEGYGLSETSSGICCNRADLDGFTGHCGVPMPGTEIRILDDEGREMPAGARGEICIRGDAVMAGYWNKPDETAKVMTADGFFRSGDIGVMDEHGSVAVVDRKKDMILVSGFNVFPNEIEDVISGLQGVRECAAVGVPDANTGEAIRLFVVGQDLDDRQVIDYARTQLVAYKVPKQIVFIDELPKSNVGKILRRELRDRQDA
ncbi:MAG: AMP-binding protein [Pseudomonadota bacterium]